MTLIRRANPRDLQGIRSVQLDSWRRTYPDVLPPEYLGAPVARDLEATWTVERLGSALVMVAEREGRILGVAATFPETDRGPYLDNLHVSSDAEGTGLGRALMHGTAQALLDMGKTTLHLTVVETNRGAIAFYQRLGGEFGAPMEDTMFDHRVAALPVFWPDISVLVAG